MTKDDLLIKAKQCGIDVQPNWTNEEIEQAIAFHFVAEKGQVHPWELRMIEHGCQMLAVALSAIPAHNHDYIVDSWRATEKCDGVRATMVLDPRLPPIFFTRGKHVDTLMPIAYQLKQFNNLRSNEKLVPIDGELVYYGNIARLAAHYNLERTLNQRTAAVAILRRSELEPDVTDLFPLTFVAFDLPNTIGGYDTRFTELKECLAELADQYIILVDTPNEGESNREYLNRMVVSGREGIILKNPTGMYHWGKSRTHAAWIKIKATNDGRSDLDECYGIEGFISGFVKSNVYSNIVASAIISNEDGVIGRIAGFSISEKMAMFLHPDSFIGRRLLVSSNGATTANVKLSHCRFVKWLADENKAEMEG